MRVEIRKMNERDTNNIIRWRNQNIVKENFIFRNEFTTEIHREWIEEYVEKGIVVQFIITELLSKVDIGSVYLRDINMTHKKAELGIFIGEEKFQSKGYGSDAIKLILDYAFNELNLNKVYLRVFENNQRAIKSYLKCGFSQEGVFMDDVFVKGEYRNIVFMAIFNEN